MSFLGQMLEMLTSYYNKSDEYNAWHQLEPETNIGKLFSLADWAYTIIQDNAELVRQWDDIDKARGVVLDRHGKNYGVARGGADDVFYRLMIKVKMLAQVSGGNIETIISSGAGLYEISPQRVELYEVFPAKVQIILYEDDLPEGYSDKRDQIGALIKRILMAGVGLDMRYIDEDTATGDLYVGGRGVAEYTRMRLPSRDT